MKNFRYKHFQQIAQKISDMPAFFTKLRKPLKMPAFRNFLKIKLVKYGQGFFLKSCVKHCFLVFHGLFCPEKLKIAKTDLQLFSEFRTIFSPFLRFFKLAKKGLTNPRFYGIIPLVWS